MVKNFLKLIRWPNLLFIAGTLFLIRYFIIESLGIPHQLSRLEFWGWVICSVSAAAAGYIVNDIFDQNADEANKPKRRVVGRKISVKNAWCLSGILGAVSLLSGFWVAQASNFESLWAVPLIAMALLYFYAVDFKKRPVLGNFIVSILVALPIFMEAVFDLLAAVTPENAAQINAVWEVLMAYAVFAFAVNFIRELIKDAEDVEGDEKSGYRTLAVIVGIKSIRWVILVLILIVLIFTGFYNLFLKDSDIYSAIYVFCFINIPILYLMYLVYDSKTKKDFKKASNWTKMVMLTGVLSMVVFTLSLQFQRKNTDEKPQPLPEKLEVEWG